jgi:hypothetical protein
MFGRIFTLLLVSIYIYMRVHMYIHMLYRNVVSVLDDGGMYVYI